MTSICSVTDRDTQYFLADASAASLKPPQATIVEQDGDQLFVCSDAVPKEGTICEVGLSELITETVTNLPQTTVRLQPTSPGTYPFFTVPDLSKDSRYADMAVVKGPPYFRFYAGMSTRFGGDDEDAD
jgi:hypothetical protein